MNWKKRYAGVPKPLTEDDERHGTKRGYTAHIRQGIKPCKACIEAHRVYIEQTKSRRIEKAKEQARREGWPEGYTLPPDDPRHGLYTTGNNWGCRCPACLTAVFNRNRADATRRAEEKGVSYIPRADAPTISPSRTRTPRGRQTPLTEDDPRHGTYAGYAAHRKQNIPPCDACKEAKRKYDRNRQKKERSL